MEKIAVKVSRLQKVTAGLAVIAVLAGGVAVVSEIDANNRIAEAFSGTTEVVAATKTIRAGDEISASDLAFVSVPNSTVADGAITKKDIDDSSKTPVGRVATQYIAKGSQLTNASTAGKDNPESLAAAIGDGMEAVTMYDEVNPDLILMDIKMPNLDGLEATRIIRQLSAEVPIIAQSAYAYEHDRNAAEEAGCNDFISKPIAQEKLKEKIKKWLK